MGQNNLNEDKIRKISDEIGLLVEQQNTINSSLVELAKDQEYKDDPSFIELTTIKVQIMEEINLLQEEQEELQIHPYRS